MKTQILLIDPLEKLVIKKDSSLMLALTLKQQGIQTFLAFPNDLCFLNKGKQSIYAYEFSGQFAEDHIYLKSIELGQKRKIELNSGVTLHMRLDPPFNDRYLRILWLLDALKDSGVRVVNDPKGIMANNEKLLAYRQENSIESFVGHNLDQLVEFCEGLKLKGHRQIIVKPVDLYQGIGVTRYSIGPNLVNDLRKNLEEFGGLVVAQPFVEEVTKGELRAFYFNSVCLATIIKIPQPGEFLANIAMGASYQLFELPTEVDLDCQKVCQGLNKQGVPWVAFDILGGRISEVNVTCPGLLVELSKAKGENLALKMIPYFTSKTGLGNLS